MDSQVVEISNFHLFLSAILLVIAGGVSALFRLGLLRSLAWGTFRCVVQLFVIGYVLGWVFSVDRVELVICLVALMCLVAAGTATRRTPNVAAFPTALAFVSMAVSTYLVMIVVCAVVIRAEPWYTARIVIPISGMILGNAVTGIALSIDRLYAEIRHRRSEVEAMLALGATPWESVRDCVREALRAGMTPTINALMVVGLVSIPGMMTGQILGGADPRTAARYQIVVMLMIAAAVAIGSMLLVGLSYGRLFNDDDALRREILKTPNE
ncbi:ABC transporter permease [Thermodesulfobacteriota bacterium]